MTVFARCLAAFRPSASFNVPLGIGRHRCGHSVVKSPMDELARRHHAENFQVSRQVKPSRRDVLLNLFATVVPLLPIGAARAEVAGDALGNKEGNCTTQSNPTSTTVTCFNFGVRKNGNLNSCTSQEACIATAAASNPTKFSPPWEPPKNSRQAKDVKSAWTLLVAAVEDQPGLKIVSRDDEKYYLRAEGKATIPVGGTDDVEFRILDELPPKATYRSATREALYVYPITQPVSNQQSHADRLEAIRKRLGWNNVGPPGDGILEKDLGFEQVKNFFGLQLQGAKVPDYDDDF